MRLQPPHVLDAVQDVTKLVWRERFGQIVEGPAAHGLDRRLDRGECRDDDHVQTWRQPQQPRQQFQAKLLAQAKVQQRHIERRDG